MRLLCVWGGGIVLTVTQPDSSKHRQVRHGILSVLQLCCDYETKGRGTLRGITYS